MKRHELEHLIRAAGAITGADEIMVIGSQADWFTFRDPKDSDLIDGSIGEGSPFHETFGYDAQGVWEDTATLPAGWCERLIRIQNDNTRNVTALCPDPHDLAVSKLVAGREKDRVFIQEMHRHQMLDESVLLQRIARLPLAQDGRRALRQRWHRIAHG
jgi:hypothetical protein